MSDLAFLTSPKRQRVNRFTIEYNHAHVIINCFSRLNTVPTHWWVLGEEIHSLALRACKEEVGFDWLFGLAFGDGDPLGVSRVQEKGNYPGAMLGAGVT